MHELWAKIGRYALQHPIGRRTTVLLAVLIVIVLFHAPILRMLAWPLEARSSSATSDYFCLHGGELDVDGFDPFDRAAEWHGQAAGRKILLLLPLASRIVEVGAVRSFEQTCRSELGKRGVPPADILPIPARARNAWDEAHALAGWLARHPDATLCVACNPFASGRLRYTYDAILGPTDGRRVRLLLLPNPQCSIKSWWRTRTGVKEFMFSWLDMLYAWREGDGVRVEQADAATFQAEVRAAIGEAPP